MNRNWWTMIPAEMAVICLVLLAGGCVCVSTEHGVSVRAVVLDDVTGDPLTDLMLGGRTFTDGVETDFNAIRTHPAQNGGAFETVFSVRGGFCDGLFAPPRPPQPEFPNPDRIEIIVRRGTCETTFSFDIDEPPVEQPDSPFAVIQLPEPILVPPCPE